jgi:hypothetical protein
MMRTQKIKNLQPSLVHPSSASRLRLQSFSICICAEDQVYINGCLNGITIYICLINSIYTVFNTIIFFCYHHASTKAPCTASSQTTCSISKPLSVGPW